MANRPPRMGPEPTTEIGRGSAPVKPKPKTYAECIAQGGAPKMCRKAFPYTNQPQ